jgi:hypothetical protein
MKNILCLPGGWMTTDGRSTRGRRAVEQFHAPQPRQLFMANRFQNTLAEPVAHEDSAMTTY